LNDDNDPVLCPFCGQENWLQFEASLAMQQFITDCEICCRPFEVTVECEAGEVLSVSVRGEG
jgi:hypothetical protein